MNSSKRPEGAEANAMSEKSREPESPAQSRNLRCPDEIAKLVVLLQSATDQAKSLGLQADGLESQTSGQIVSRSLQVDRCPPGWYYCDGVCQAGPCKPKQV